MYLSELEPFVIELPDDVANEEEEELIEKMRLHSGVKYLRLRRLTKPRDHVVVSAVGTMESLHRLRALVAVKPSLNSFNNTKKRSEMVSRLVYERISALV
ncbi:unnamed protein product [Anisakis simplex]|uniref:DUF7636 domain-containing protein n=1 Tax=Anisakis simplex TaxID=6269 RepID=A0A0M3JIE5_ANISI|nr:unnamed protein product [Anisakis simplex]